MRVAASRVLDRGEQRVDPLAGLGGNQETRALRRTARGDILQVLALVGVEAIDLVPDFENALSGIGIDAELAQHGIDVALLRLGVLMRDVADVENDVGLQHFLQRGAKRRNQLRRQIGDEADRVRQHRLAADAAGFSARKVGSSVANSMSAACTSARVRRLNSVDLPALV